MRIAFFDGILETHVPDSLERALRRRGHQVLNRGKFGHGFKFPGISQNMSRIHSEIDEVLSFCPDLVLVFRPALLPPEVIGRFKNRGITLAAWFSDDPVLFDLSYGPVVEHYDFILHCGNEKILQYYEDFFGFATGVNFPFWTDQSSFPKLWEPNGFFSDAVFLGNVQDEVRRQRYFDLGQMQNSVRIHGNVGTDYYGVWGGFLDSDVEVAHSIAKSKVAINIPQFFADHHGLETWFPDLDDLGFFEFPSRVIQYMAVGLPTVTLLPYEYTFESFPEMLVFKDVSEIDDFLNSVSLEELQFLSDTTSSRFVQNFSADSRAQALEAAVEDSSWRNLSAYERSLWFMNFTPDDNEGENEEPYRETVRARREITKPNTRALSTAHPQRIACITSDKYRELSAAGIIMRGLENLGHSVEVFEGSVDGMLVADPSHLFKFAPSVGFIQSLSTFDSVIFVGDDFSITQYGTSVLEAHNVTSYKISQAYSSVNSKRNRELERFNYVLYTNSFTYSDASALGKHNAHFLPPVPDKTFIELILEDEQQPTGTVRITTTPQHDESLSPAFLTDIRSATRTATVDDIKSMSLKEAAVFLRSAATFMSFSGTRNAVEPGEIFPYVVTASDLVFAPRSTRPEIFWKWLDAMVQVRDVGELNAKSRLLAKTLSLLEAKVSTRDQILERISIEDYLNEIIAQPRSAEVTSVYAKNHDEDIYLLPGETFRLSTISESKEPTVFKMEVVSPFKADDIKSLLVNTTELTVQFPEDGQLKLYVQAPHETSIELRDSNRRIPTKNQRPMVRLQVLKHAAAAINPITLSKELESGILNQSSPSRHKIREE